MPPVNRCECRVIHIDQHRFPDDPLPVPGYVKVDRCAHCKEVAAVARELAASAQGLYPHIHDRKMEGETGFERAWLRMERAIARASACGLGGE